MPFVVLHIYCYHKVHGFPKGYWLEDIMFRYVVHCPLYFEIIFGNIDYEIVV